MTHMLFDEKHAKLAVGHHAPLRPADVKHSEPRFFFVKSNTLIIIFRFWLNTNLLQTHRKSSCCTRADECRGYRDADD